MTQMWVHISLEVPATLPHSPEADPRIQEPSGSKVRGGSSPGSVTNPLTLRWLEGTADALHMQQPRDQRLQAVPEWR